MGDDTKKPRKRDEWCEWKCSWCEVAHEKPCTFFADNQPFCGLDCIAELGAELMKRDQGEPAYITDMEMPGPDEFAESFQECLVGIAEPKLETVDDIFDEIIGPSALSKRITGA